MKPRILLITPSPPFPANNGGAVRILSLVGKLREHFDFLLLTFAPRTGKFRFQHHAAMLALKNLFVETHCIPLETTEAACSTPIPAGGALPGFVAEWYSQEMAAAVEQITSERRVDLVHIEFLLMAAYVWHVRNIPTVLTEHDVGHLSFFNSYFRERSGLRSLGQIGEWLRTRRFHRQACQRFSRVVALTPADMLLVKKTIPAERLTLVPTGVNLEKFKYQPETAEGRPVDLAYVGHYPHYPNEDAALWFCRKIFPRICSQRPETTLSLIGSGPTSKILALASPQIEITGTVAEVMPCLDRAKVFVAPLRLSEGVKGKVLEAFARGLPVVATSIVQKGIPQARDNEHLLVADSPSEFADAVLRLLGDAALRKRFAGSGRKLVERHYSWDRSSRDLETLYCDLLRI